MDYVREHIKRYWYLVYKRTIGIGLITLAIFLSIGLTFTVLRTSLAVNSFNAYIMFWVFLAIAAIVIIATSFIRSHISSVRLMNEIEHRDHSKHVAVWMISTVLGVLRIHNAPSLCQNRASNLSHASLLLWWHTVDIIPHNTAYIQTAFCELSYRGNSILGNVHYRPYPIRKS